jgi:hypothetical protein
MLTATVVALTGLVAVLGVLVVGLLRSHAEILRRLHELGAGVYDDSARAVRPLPVEPAPGPGPTRAGLPTTLAGATPLGGAVSIALEGHDSATLLAFLSTGCVTCAEFWDVLGADAASRSGAGPVRTVVVTRGPDQESPPEVAGLAPAGVPTVMSTDAWRAFGVPASPYFVLLDPSGNVVGEGTARSWPQVTGLIDRAARDGVLA